MIFKTSLFKKGLIISDLKRFWWVSAIYTLLLLFILPLRALLQGIPDNDYAKEQIRDVLNMTSSPLNLQILMICVIPVILGVLLFRYLQVSNSSAMSHSLPCNRKILYLSHILSGLLMLLIPILVTGLILTATQSLTFLKEYISLLKIFEWMGMSLVFNLFFFSFTIFTGFFTGSSIATIAFTYILQILPAGVSVLLESNLKDLFYGFGSKNLGYGLIDFLPLIKLAMDFRWVPLRLFIIYTLSGILLLIASGFIYKIRKLETAGDIIAFSAIKPIFKYGVSICCALVGGAYLSSASTGSFIVILFGYLITSFLGYWIAEILIYKSFRVWKAYKSYLIYTGILLLVLFGINSDLTGYVNNIPQAENVENVYIGYSYDMWRSIINKDGKYPNEQYGGGFLLKNSDNIQNVIKLHKRLIKKPYTKNGYNKYLIYTLKNGNHISRNYSMDEEIFKKELTPIFESQEYKKNTYPILSQKPQDIRVIEFKEERAQKKAFSISDQAKVSELITLFQNEIKKMTYTQILNSNNFINLQLLGPADKTLRYYSIPRSFTSVLQWLKDNDYYDKIVLNSRDVESIILEKHHITYVQKNQAISDPSKPLEIKDPKLIEELLNIDNQNNIRNSSEFYTFMIILKDSVIKEGSNTTFYNNSVLSDGLRAIINKME